VEKLDNAVRQEIFRLTDQFVAEGDSSRDTAMIMVAALFVGPDIGAVAEITGCSVELVSVIAARLRASAMWTEAGVDYADWFADSNMGVAHFALDLDVSTGVFIRTSKNENGQYGYKLVDEAPDAALEEEWDGAEFPNPKSSIH
jgi:hypothetical protein